MRISGLGELGAVVDEIKSSVKAREGAVQVPKRELAIDALPLTGLGKPDKEALRARFWCHRQRSVG